MAEAIIAKAFLFSMYYWTGFETVEIEMNYIQNEFQYSIAIAVHVYVYLRI